VNALPEAAVSAAVAIRGVSHRYGDRLALDDLSLNIAPQEIFGFLGPNGGGKTTLFRLLSTLVRPQSGEISVLGRDLVADQVAVREQIGVVFQAPSLDKKLTVAENLRHHGRLYGLRGRDLETRASEMLERLGLSDRRDTLAEELSGGLRRRVELAKGLLHRPRLLLLDEPSTGLDPAARSDLWQYLELVRGRDGVTVVLTTHLLEEAERADRLAILDRGRLVALDTPANLRASVGGDSITIEAESPPEIVDDLQRRFGLTARVVGHTVRLEIPEGRRRVSELAESFGTRIRSITCGQPTLEDVFIARTGHRFWAERAE
jgi:ABC-2 type transport system ATP-binding protein